jgi:hypothetical protein
MEKTKINSKIFCALLMFVLIASITTTAAPVKADPVFHTCDSAGNAKNIFNPSWSTNGVTWQDGENVSFTATGLAPTTTYPIYVFIKNVSWTMGMAFPTRYYHTATSVTTDGSGNVVPTTIYSQITGGEYYVAVDINSNGIYDSGDLLINDVSVTLALIALDSVGNVQTALYLTPDQLYAMPSYTGVGLPRRSGGYYPLQQLGNYTGIPLPYLCNLLGGMSSGNVLTYATAVDYYSGSLSYYQVYENNYPQYNITIGAQNQGGGDAAALMSGQNPLMMLAYAVNGTNLYSDVSGGGDNDLGGPFRIYVVSNNGTSSILANDGMATFGNNFCKFVTSLVIRNPGTLTYNTTDSSGTTKSTFNRNETVHFSATGLSALTPYSIYIVDHASSWVVRTAIPDRISGSEESVQTDESGNILAGDNPIYYGTQAGNYDVIVDLNDNSIYDETDLLIYNMAGTCGFSVT